MNRQNPGSGWVSLFSAIAITGLIFGALALITVVRMKLAAEGQSRPMEVRFEQIETEKTEEKAAQKRQVSRMMHVVAHVEPYRIAKESRKEADHWITPPTDSVPQVEYEYDFEAEINPEQKAPPERRVARTTKSVPKPTHSKKERESAHAKKITKKPSVVSSPSPRYPRTARRRGQEGRVLVKVYIGSSGQVSSAQVQSGSGYSALDSAALVAARKWRFSPAMNGLGQPVGFHRLIPFKFQLN